MYENTSYDGRKRCKGCTVLNRLRERNASPDRISVCWQSDDRQSGVLEVIAMKPWHAHCLARSFFDRFDSWRINVTIKQKYIEKELSAKKHIDTLHEMLTFENDLKDDIYLD